MLKNKDGSYNKFPLLIVGLIALISVCIIGMLIAENIDFPEAYTTPPTPTIVPIETYIRENISSDLLLYNATVGMTYTNYTYGEYKNWNEINNTNVTYVYVVGGGGGTGYGGWSGVDGGGGQIQSTQSPEITPTLLTSQNISSIIIYLNPFGSDLFGSYILILLLAFPITLILFNSRQAFIGILMMLLLACFFNFISFSNLIISGIMILPIYMLMTSLFDR